MRQIVLTVTERGEGNVTNALLLGIFSDVIYQALQSADFHSPTCASVCTALNLLGKLGWIEVREQGQPPRDPGLNTEAPPNFFDVFGKKEDGDGKATG